jgi:Tfp pilus assembly protein PilN
LVELLSTTSNRFIKLSGLGLTPAKYAIKRCISIGNKKGTRQAQIIRMNQQKLNPPHAILVYLNVKGQDPTQAQILQTNRQNLPAQDIGGIICISNARTSLWVQILKINQQNLPV